MKVASSAPITTTLDGIAGGLDFCLVTTSFITLQRESKGGFAVALSFFDETVDLSSVSLVLTLPGPGTNGA
jgi:hypothetical protein